MEYGSPCWNPTNSKLENELERVNRNAAKFVTGIYPKKGKYDQFCMSKLMDNLNWKTLEQRRQQARITMAYKILNLTRPSIVRNYCICRYSRLILDVLVSIGHVL